jgi:non-heme chloroperoxidase
MRCLGSFFSEWFFQLGLQAAGWSTAAILVSLRDEKMYPDLHKIFVPTLIIHGIHDKAIPFSQSLELNKNKKFTTCPVSIQRSRPFLGRTRQV